MRVRTLMHCALGIFLSSMRLVGTAGHVDHGKSTLVLALTGIDPDRLLEEQRRAMTIELGFAWLTLPHGETISLVDVPGHEAFIKNMLAGAGGMDAALLVIAADEGIMPQTREHLAILDLVNLQGGVVALTKTDLPLEPGWLELVEKEIRAELAGTVLQDAAIIPVSAKTGRGLDALKAALEQVLAHVVEKPDRRRPRLPIDRVFTMSGFGTVVTGTLADGEFAVGDAVEIAPSGIATRVRGIQAHNQKIERALPGGRVALNLANVATDAIARGDVVIHPGTYTPTSLLDAHIEWLASAPKPLSHNQELELFIYASQVNARVRLLEGDTLAPGQHAWAQLVLNQLVIAAKGDHFILRVPSPSMTVGGGIVVDPHPAARHKRGRPEVLAQLARAERGTPEEVVPQFLEAHPASGAVEIAQGIGFPLETVEPILTAQVGQGSLISLPNDPALYLTADTWKRWLARLSAELGAYHQQFPMRGGMPRQELKSRVALPPQAFDPALAYAVASGSLRVTDKTVALAAHRVQFNATTQNRVTQILEQFARAPYNPPSVTDIEPLVGKETLNALIEQGTLERVAPNVLFLPEAVAAMQAWVLATITAQGQTTAAELRDHFATSRKYAIALLEYLDARHITKRDGDARILR